MKISITLILLISLLTQFGCEDHITDYEIKNISPFTINYPKYLRFGDSTVVSVTINDSAYLKYSYQWDTDIGKINHSGTQTIFKAPDSVCSATIELRVIDGTCLLEEHSFTISIFKQLVIIKADDLMNDHRTIVSHKWHTFIDYIYREKIKASLGLVGRSLELGGISYHHYLRILVNSGAFELWNHGYTHVLQKRSLNGQLYDEFHNTPLEYQEKHLRKTQALAKEKLNLILHEFGAPGNSTDENTMHALESINEIKISFDNIKSWNGIVLPIMNGVENPVGNPELEYLVNKYKDNELIVIQIHPNQWDANKFENFEQIISYLKSKDATFILPYDYYLLSKQ